MTRFLPFLLVVACARPAADTTPKLAEILARLDAIQKQQTDQERQMRRLGDRLAEIRSEQEDLRAMVSSSMVDLRADLRKVGASGSAPAAPPPVRRNQPDPAKVYSVPIDGDPVRGDKKAKVTLVWAQEAMCPFCVRVRKTIAELEKKYGKDLRVVAKDFIVHPQTATLPALAACAAHKQGAYWEYEDAMITQAWDIDPPKLKDATLLQRDALIDLARSLRLDVKQFEKDLDSQDCQDQLAADQAALGAVGARGTPAFYINGRFLSGAQPIDRFEALIDEELAKAKEAIKNGVKAEKYYQKTVVDGGEKAVSP